MTRAPELHGVLAEFASPEALVRAARGARAAGHARLDAHTPQPLEEVAEALALPPSRLPRLVLLGGLAGAAGGFGLQAWASVVAYPLNVGGRPHFSWPAFIVPAFETCILLAALTAVLGLFALAGLPRPHHPLFAVPRFEHASRDAYFLCIEADGIGFDAAAAHRLLSDLGATETWDVPA